VWYNSQISYADLTFGNCWAARSAFPPYGGAISFTMLAFGNCWAARSAFPPYGGAISFTTVGFRELLGGAQRLPPLRRRNFFYDCWLSEIAWRRAAPSRLTAAAISLAAVGFEMKA